MQHDPKTVKQNTGWYIKCHMPYYNVFTERQNEITAEVCHQFITGIMLKTAISI